MSPRSAFPLLAAAALLLLPPAAAAQVPVPGAADPSRPHWNDPHPTRPPPFAVPTGRPVAPGVLPPDPVGQNIRKPYEQPKGGTPGLWRDQYPKSRVHKPRRHKR